MLQNWVFESGRRKPFSAFSYADRGDVWPVEDITGHGGWDSPMMAEGMVAGTLVATEMGWLPVEDLRPGDRVVTFDNGMVPVRDAAVSQLMTGGSRVPRAYWPLSVPEKALGNRKEMLLLPEQSVLIESDEGEDLFGDPFLLVAASALDGYCGIERVAPATEMKIVTLRFDSEEVVYANGMVLMHCPKPASERRQSPDELIKGGEEVLYQRLPRAQSAMLVQAMRASATGQAVPVHMAG